MDYTAKSVTYQRAGCPICGKIKACKSRTKTKEQFIEELNNVNKNIDVLGEYINTHTKIKCRCKIDNTIWYAYPANLLNNSAGCPKCSMSNGETKLLSILSKLNIEYATQHTIEDCKYVSKLKFDAFDVQNNIAFEYNGEQHYFPVDFGNKGDDYAYREFLLTQNRDNAKIEYCKNNNIPMIIVPYWEKDNMESFIIKELNNIQGEYMV